MINQIHATGNLKPRIMVIGDMPQTIDMLRGTVFSDSDGYELRRLLFEAGIPESEVYFTTLLKHFPRGGDASLFFDFKTKRPLDNTMHECGEFLKKEIEACKPNIIITLGGLPLYIINGDSAISTWRGSLLSFQGIKVIPTYSPSQIRSTWEWRALALHDIKRAESLSHTPDFPEVPYNFLIRPGFEEARGSLENLLGLAEYGNLKLSVDIETRFGHIACIGIAWSSFDAVCIPLLCVERPEGYWPEAEELALMLLMRQILQHPNVSCIGQNFLYDSQYFAKHFGYVPNLLEDTMFQQHVLFPGLPKGLDFLASMYSQHYVYWKGEGKEWNNKIPEEQYWGYNCKDACYTFEVQSVMDRLIDETNLREQYAFQMSLFFPVLRMMLRGCPINLALRKQLGEELITEIMTRQFEVNTMVGHTLNPKSPLQMRKLFYDDFKLPVQRTRSRPSTVTTNDEALEKLGNLEPLVLPLTKKLREMRSLGVFHSTFVCATLGADNRIRCSFNPAGTETYRFNSSKDAFGSGTNLQNIPAGDEDEDHEAGALVLPNIRKLFVPSQEHIIFDVDLAGADAQVVAWEAHDDMLKELFRSGQKLHAVNAKDMFGSDAGADGKKMPYYAYAKAGCHLTNYGGKPRTLAMATGMTMKQSEAFQNRWFDIHPGIREWHERIQNELETRRFVENKFGYRRFYFDRIEGILPQALAWIPQSTVACVTNRQLEKVDRTIPSIELLIQVHDSLVGQLHRSNWFLAKPLLQDALKVLVPYDDPLIIPSGLKTSQKSWGDCVTEAW